MSRRTGRSLRRRLAGVLERPPWWIFPIQGGAVLAVALFLVLPLYLAGSPSAYDGAARVVECHRWPATLWLYYHCHVAPPGGDRPPLGAYSGSAVATHDLHGVAEFAMHGIHVRRSGNLTMLIAKGTPGLPQWSLVLGFPGFFAVTFLIAAVEGRGTKRLARALRRSADRARPEVGCDGAMKRDTD